MELINIDDALEEDTARVMNQKKETPKIEKDAFKKID